MATSTVWKIEKLSQILSYLESGSRPKGGVNGISKGIVSVGGEHIDYNGNFDFSKVKFIPEAFFETMSKGKIFPGDVLIVKDGATTGKVAIVDKSFPYEKAAVNEHVFILRPDEKVFSKFLFYYLFSLEGQLQIKKCITGSAQGGINKSILEKISVRFPQSKGEQEMIVSEIEKQLTRLEKSVKTITQLKSKLEIYRKSILKKSFQGVWKIVPISDIIETINNGYTPTSEKMTRGNGVIPFIKVYNLTFTGKLDFTNKPTFIDAETHTKMLKRSITLPGDVLINIVGPPLGKVSVVPNTFPEWNINQAIVLYRPNDKVSPKFLSYYLQNPETILWFIKNSNTTAGQHNVKVSTCRLLPFPDIPISLQKKITQEIETQFSVIDKLQNTIENSLLKTDSLRKSILKSAFEGKLVNGVPV